MMQRWGSKRDGFVTGVTWAVFFENKSKTGCSRAVVFELFERKG
jgi:hypothetical protein